MSSTLSATPSFTSQLTPDNVHATFPVQLLVPGQTATPETPAGVVVVPGGDALEQELLRSAVEVLGDRSLDDLGAYRLPTGFKLSILVPVYNERRTIQQILARVRALPVPKEVIVVDDGSTDGTAEVLRGIREDNELRIFFHPRNQGKGAAIRTAMERARGSVVAIQDADLEYDPNELLQLIRPIVAGEADVVYGSRFAHGKPVSQTRRHWLANRVLTMLSNLFTDLSLTDMETCHKVIRREALRGVTISQCRFGMEPELTAKMARRGCRFMEMPIGYHGRDASEGKKIGLKDAFNALWCIVRYSIAD